MNIKYKLALFTLGIFFIGCLVFRPHQIFADEVKIATQGGAMYLTTTTTTTTRTVLPATVQTATSSSATTSTGTIFLDGPITLPVGFFPSAQALVDQIFKVIMVVSVVLVFAFLVLGGIDYITSGGEKGKTEAARNKITSAIIGLIIVAASYAILTIVVKFIGFQDLSGIINLNFTNSATSSAQTASASSPLKQLLQ